MPSIVCESLTDILTAGFAETLSHRRYDVLIISAHTLVRIEELQQGVLRLLYETASIYAAV